MEKLGIGSNAALATMGLGCWFPLELGNQHFQCEFLIGK